MQHQQSAIIPSSIRSSQITDSFQKHVEIDLFQSSVTTHSG